jgi:prolyl oligopeptidase
VTNEVTLYVAPLKSLTGSSVPWKEFCDVDDDVTGFDVHGDDLYLQSHKNASRYKVLHTHLSNPDVAGAEVAIPPGEAVVRNISAASDGLYIQDLDGGLGRLLRLPYAGGKAEQISLPFDGSINIASTDQRLPGAVIWLASWVNAGGLYSYDPSSKQLSDTKLQPAGPFDKPADVESLEVKVKSYDGTEVPLSIVRKKGVVLDGSHPTRLEGYGAYGITLDPYFDPTVLAWLEHGGIYAIAHVRGGGEFGEDWHLAAKQLTKPNTWKDFIVCAQYLIDQKYTSPSRLAIEGGSAGGITIGRSITERPDLFAAAIDGVPMSDVVRAEFTPNGPPNIPEFGTVKTPEGFKALYEMSAYAHVKDGTPYPAVIVTTGFNDPRVASWQPGKMAARLQAATSSGKPVLLRVDYDAGHGMGSTKSQRQVLHADEWSFELWQFGVPQFQPPK